VFFLPSHLISEWFSTGGIFLKIGTQARCPLAVLTSSRESKVGIASWTGRPASIVGWAVSFSIKGQLSRIDDIRTKVDFAMDDKKFLQKLQQTQVLATNEYTKWDWDQIEEALEGPLRNPAHLTTATQKNVKFIKRIISFLKPQERGFFLTEPYTMVIFPKTKPQEY